MFVSKPWIYLLILTLATCIESENPEEFDELDDSRPDDAMTSLEKEDLLKMQNDLRRMAKASDMNRLKWSTTLESEAELLAEMCVSEDSKEFKKMSHSNHVATKYYMAPFHPTAWMAFKRWFDEMALYYDPERCTNRVLCQDAKKILLARSRFTGCAMKTCNPDFIKTDLVKGQLLVCVYSHVPFEEELEEGVSSIVSSKTFQPGEPCTKCRSFYQACVDDLCDDKPALGMARGSAARPVPTHPSAILTAVITGLAISTIGTRFVEL